MSRDVTAIVLAASGGVRLERSLASVEWAAGDRPEHAPLDRFDWHGIAADTVAFYRLVRGETLSRPPTPIHASVRS